MVLVDDFFAAVDLTTEASVQPALDALLEGRTALIVSHRRYVIGLDFVGCSTSV